MGTEGRAFILPTSIVSPTDVSRLLREVDALETYFRQSEIRQSGEEQSAMPRPSKLLDNLATDNQLNLLQRDHREFAQESLKLLHSSAPVIHMSFSVDPPGSYTQKIVAWLRANIHATVLVTVGLQPNIGAGCVMRTTNKIFDFSLREYFHEKRDFFIGKMHDAIVDKGSEVSGSTESDPQAVAAEVPTPVPGAAEPVPASQPPQATPVPPSTPVAVEQAAQTAEDTQDVAELPTPVTQEEAVT